MSRNQTLLLTGVFLLGVIAFFFASGLFDPESPQAGSVRVVPASDVDWQLLNPLRGDKSPRAGTLWGDRGAPVPCGFLVKFVDGFSSPPHIHPVTYRGVVISGLVHNDDPKAKEEWLPTGTFWTQPAGEVHITAAKGSENVAYIEIEKGPYLVLPSKEAFQPPETPVKMTPSSMPWADAVASAKIAPLPGNPDDGKLHRSLVKLPPGFTGSVHGPGPALHVVVVEGKLEHEVPDKSDGQTLDQGSYFGSEGEVAHQLACESGCLLYVRTKGTFEVTSSQP